MSDKTQTNPLDSDRPSHGRRSHQRALFVRLFRSQWSVIDITTVDLEAPIKVKE